jgi:FkbM family methyltransferase
MNLKQFIFKIPFFYWIYKLQKLYKNKKSNSHYGEFGEDIIINRLFRNIDRGFYIDIGAYHPFKGSLTYLLYKKGWNGLNIDISKVSIDLFNIARQHDININCAVSNVDKETFYYSNSLINQQNSLIQRGESQKKIPIKSFKLETLLKIYNIKNFEYLNIDTEGNEAEIIKSINFQKYKPILVTVEINDFFSNKSNKNEIIKYFSLNNYELFNIIGVTYIFVNKDHVGKVFDYISI